MPFSPPAIVPSPHQLEKTTTATTATITVTTGGSTLPTTLSLSPVPIVVYKERPNLIPIFKMTNRSEHITSLLDPTRDNAPASTLDSLLWLTAASRDGDPRAQFTLAHLFYYGKHIQRDPARAFEYRLRAARGGHIEAMACVARSLLTGDGVAQNEKEGVSWVHLAAMKGHP